MVYVVLFLVLCVGIALSGCSDFKNCNECTDNYKCVWCSNDGGGCFAGSMFGKKGDRLNNDKCKDYKWLLCDIKGINFVYASGIIIAAALLACCVCTIVCVGIPVVLIALSIAIFGVKKSLKRSKEEKLLKEESILDEKYGAVSD